MGASVEMPESLSSVLGGSVGSVCPWNGAVLWVGLLDVLGDAMGVCVLLPARSWGLWVVVAFGRLEHVGGRGAQGGKGGGGGGRRAG